MKIKFWGVRGSIPTPGKNFTKFGGNTSCVELHVNNKLIIFDMGSGLVNLGNYLFKKNIKKFKKTQHGFAYHPSPIFEADHPFSWYLALLGAKYIDKANKNVKT